jgi:DNA-binding MarR family transcriptional regulator/GNAT superfamily N-acetyltransferase
MHLSAREVSLVRAFNRDYTRRIGVLQDGLLATRYTLTQVRVMYELGHRRGVTAAELADELGLDKGYLSRLLNGFERKGWLGRKTSASDGRRQHLSLTSRGHAVLAPLEQRAKIEVRRMLEPLDAAGTRTVLDAMRAIHDSFTMRRPSGRLRFRAHRVGDMGWVTARHGELYAAEYRWNADFEALVAQITAQFVQKLDPQRERCWIAERDGRRLGCIFLVASDSQTAKLRLLLVEPEARGLGLGRALIGRCVRFARSRGYRRITLWTQQTLVAARKLYQRAGFVKIAEQPHQSFGASLIGETWELKL